MILCLEHFRLKLEPIITLKFYLFETYNFIILHLKKQHKMLCKMSNIIEDEFSLFNNFCFYFIKHGARHVKEHLV